MLDSLPTITITSGARASYLQQSVRTPGAAAVPPGGLKPTTVLGLVSKSVALRVYATLSDPVSRFDVSDYAVLQRFISTELLWTVARKIEADVISGADPNGIAGITTTSGIQTSAWNTDAVTSLRDGLTKLQTLGSTPARCTR